MCVNKPTGKVSLCLFLHMISLWSGECFCKIGGISQTRKLAAPGKGDWGNWWHQNTCTLKKMNGLQICGANFNISGRRKGHGNSFLFFTTRVRTTIRKCSNNWKTDISIKYLPVSGKMVSVLKVALTVCWKDDMWWKTAESCEGKWQMLGMPNGEEKFLQWSVAKCHWDEKCLYHLVNGNLI